MKTFKPEELSFEEFFSVIKNNEYDIFDKNLKSFEGLRDLIIKDVTQNRKADLAKLEVLRSDLLAWRTIVIEMKGKRALYSLKHLEEQHKAKIIHFETVIEAALEDLNDRIRRKQALPKANNFIAMNTPKIFLSYAWDGESEMIVNELDSAFRNKDIVLMRDKRDLGFKGMITEFMQKIGEGNAVVAVISDKYLKSPYCMFELLEIYRNLNFQKRIFPIVMEDANIFDPIPRLQYLKYWQDKKKELDDAITQFGADAITVIGEDYKVYKKIFDNCGDVINILKDINSLTPDMHRTNNFQVLIEAVEKCINQ